MELEIKCVFVSSSSYEKLKRLGLENLAYEKPIKKLKVLYSKGARCWIDPEYFKTIWRMNNGN